MIQDAVNNLKKNGQDFKSMVEAIHAADPKAQPEQIAQEASYETSLYYCLSEAKEISSKCKNKSRELSLVITKLEEALFWASQMP